MTTLSGLDPTLLIQFKNCFLLRDHAIVKEDLWVRNKKIVDPEPIFFTEKVSSDVQVDCKNFIISPGFIDLQINGGFGADFTHDDGSVEEGVSKVAQNILAHGVTSFCPTIITSPKEKYQKILPNIKKKDGGKDGAGILGVHLEGPFINREKKGAHSVQFIRSLEGGLADLKAVYGDLKDVSIVTLAPELDRNSSVVQELSQEGITVALGHSAGNLSDGEKAINAGASLITHLFNAMLPFHHRDPGLVGLLSSHSIIPKKTVYYGIIADGIHTHPATLRIAHKSNPLGLVLVTDAISAMGLQEGRHYIGDQQVEIRGGKAFIAGTDTLCGCIATMDACVRFFQEATGCSQVEALECATLHPAQALQIIQSKGTLDYGTDADFVLLNDQLHVQASYIAGQCVWDKDDKHIQV